MRIGHIEQLRTRSLHTCKFYFLSHAYPHVLGPQEHVRLFEWRLPGAVQRCPLSREQGSVRESAVWDTVVVNKEGSLGGGNNNIRCLSVYNSCSLFY